MGGTSFLPVRTPTCVPGVHIATSAAVDCPANAVFYGLTTGSGQTWALTRDPAVAALAGWSPLGHLRPDGRFHVDEVSDSAQVKYVDLYEMLVRRTSPMTGGLLRHKHLGVVGNGASINVTKSAARTGVGKFSLWDMQSVDLPNLGRTAYELADLGMSKTAAAARHILKLNPTAQVSQYQGNFLHVPNNELRRQISACDLLIVGTDHEPAQLRANEVGYAAGKPMVFPGFYAQAAGGEIVIVVPPGPCYRCQVRTRFEGSRQAANLDAEPGLIFDCDHLDSIAGKIAIALMLGEEVPTFRSLRDHVAVHSLLIAKNDPGFLVAGVDLFGDFFGASPLAFAYETLWLDPSGWRDHDCAVCGAGAKREKTGGDGRDGEAQVTAAISK